jgi:outer membrane receptor for ferrienterochelin and colicin
MTRVVRVCACLALSLAFASVLFAQSEAISGVIEGTVYDPNGAVMGGVAVTLKNTGTNYEQTLTTNKEGRFRALRLPPGPYVLTAAVQGFATFKREGIDLVVGQTVTLSLKMELASVTQEVRVSGEAPAIETARIEGATRIDKQAVENLPNNGHNFIDFTKLTPGVSTVQGPDGDEITINGQKGIQNNVSVDGADFNNPFFGEYRGGQRPAFTFNLDAVQQVVVVADGANAEYGRSSSGFINVITKSGTNDLHGTAHYYYTSDSLSATPVTENDVPDPFTGYRHQVGATLGGPLMKDKLFYFLSGDFNIQQDTKQNNPARIEQRVVDAFAALGSPDENGNIKRNNDARVALLKLDYQPTSQNLATLRYNYTWADQNNGTFDVNSWGRSANANEQDWSNAVTGSLLTTINPNMSNEFRAQWAREDRPRPYNGPNITGQDRPLPDTAFDFARAYRFGEPFFIPVKYYDTRFQINDNVTYYFGQHTFKGGVEYNQTSAVQTFIGFANGRWIFDSTDGFLNFLHDPKYVECSGPSAPDHHSCPGAGNSITGPVLLYLQQAGVGNISVEQAGTQTITQKEPAVFVQDVWQPMPNLTVQIGLRWEAQLEPAPITPPSQVFFAPFIGKTVNGQKFPSDGTIPSDTSMWQPRLGVSYDPWNDGKTALRANFGLYYGRIPGLVLASTRSTNGSLGQTISAGSAFGTLPASYQDLIPASQIGNPDHPQVYVVSTGFRNPRTIAYSVGGEREIVPGWAAGLKYNNAATDFLTRFINRNDPLFGSPWSTGLGADGKNGISSDPGTGLTTVESTARSRYWGLTFSVIKQMRDNLALQVNYTYSKDKSDDDNERDPFTYSYAKANDLGPEYGLSNRDQPHRVNAWLLYQAPWQLLFNARYTYLSAQPQSLTITGAVANTPQDRCVPTPCTAASLVVTRNLGRKDNQYSSLDLRLSRVFSLGGSATIEPSLDLFNVANSKNIKAPQTTNLIFNFDGTVQAGSGAPRVLQLGARVAF